jgi:hypothetical protein
MHPLALPPNHRHKHMGCLQVVGKVTPATKGKTRQEFLLANLEGTYKLSARVKACTKKYTAEQTFRWVGNPAR